MGVARIFQRGGHTDSYIGYSPNCHLNIVGCLLTKRLTKGGSRAPQDPPWLRPWGFFFLRRGYSFLPRGYSFCREVFLFGARFFFLPRVFFFFREVNSFALTVMGHRSFGR